MTGKLSRIWIAPLLAFLALFAVATWVATSFTILDADVLACSVAGALLALPLAVVALRARSQGGFIVGSALVIAVAAVALVLVLGSHDNVVRPKEIAWPLAIAAAFAIVVPALVGASPRRAALTVLVTAPFVAIPTTPTLFFWVAPLAVLVGSAVVFGEIVLERRDEVVPSEDVPTTASRPRLVAITTAVVAIASALGVVAAFVTAPAISTPAAIRSFYGKGTTYRLDNTSIPDLRIYWVSTMEPRYQRRRVGWDRNRRVIVNGKEVFVRLSHDDVDRAAADAIEYLIGDQDAFLVANRTKRSGNEVSFVYTFYRSWRGFATTVNLDTGTLGPETIVPLEHGESSGSMGNPSANARNTYRGY
jgi:hypothetical protein